MEEICPKCKNVIQNFDKYENYICPKCNFDLRDCIQCNHDNRYHAVDKYTITISLKIKNPKPNHAYCIICNQEGKECSVPIERNKKLRKMKTNIQ